MKKIVAGGIILFCGIILYLGIHIPAAYHASKLGSWSTPPGRLGTALNEMGGATATYYSVIMIIGGMILLVWGCFDDEITSALKKLRKFINS
ncbi:hypothetical protein E5161_04015 [Cohnella pontilimi]|uniref:Uncharacterized protein n=1 Tax=Cohnella pontilimi TaxID=2564100 RepID=A0A4U0FE32_9BACL|nr:hypothetical protein [Cohnella pontilimi]TJY43071.1 hypothetical protein E5161_04015 [Cohnella pontilimi]